MVFFPPDTPHNLFQGTTETWCKERDGMPAGPAPHTVARQTEHGCEVIKTFTSPDGKIRYETGMQGHVLTVLKRPNKMEVAKIFIQGVTQTGPGPGDNNQWVPRANIKIGSQWRDRLQDWPIHIDKSVGAASSRAAISSGSGNQILDRTVTGIIQAFIDSPAAFMGTSVSQLAETHGVAGIVKMIIQGIKAAGLYDVLNKQDCTKTDLSTASKCDIGPNKGKGKIGVYVRFQKSGAYVEHWSPDTWYAYVGQTRDSFYQRYDTHLNGNTRIAILNRGSTNLRTFVLCVLDSQTPPIVFFLAEQLFVCLFGTYVSGLLEESVARTGMFKLSMIEAAAYCSSISNAVFEVTKWKVLLKRSGFSGFEGSNIQSPLEEIGERKEKMLWLRTDFKIKDFETGTSYTMAQFRRHVPKTVTYSETNTFILSDLSTPVSVTSGKSDSYSLTENVTSPSDLNGEIYPLPKSEMQVIFEVRLDGKPHPKSYARLPCIGPFENWDQVNSLAVRYEWEHPRGSGKWRLRYVQARQLLAKRARDIPGSLTRYALAVTYIHWLFGAGRATFPSWIAPPGKARVLQLVYDYMSQSIRIQVPGQYQMLPSTRRSNATLESMMESYNLGKFEDVDTLKAYQSKARETCDLCMFLQYMAKGSPEMGTSCERTGNTCSNCCKWGLPRCPWTPGLVSETAIMTIQGSGTGNISGDEEVTFYRVREILIARAEAIQQPETNTFAQELVALQKQELRDESDIEHDDEDEV